MQSVAKKQVVQTNSPQQILKVVVQNPYEAAYILSRGAKELNMSFVSVKDLADHFLSRYSMQLDLGWLGRTLNVAVTKKIGISKKKGKNPQTGREVTLFRSTL